ncbi:MAG: hypothetical protein HRK26_00810 [Rickettsiaceae bacterium H1]|nr:hypothetical protein [Rickettsiaceae bacterium H1]
MNIRLLLSEKKESVKTEGLKLIRQQLNKTLIDKLSLLNDYAKKNVEYSIVNLTEYESKKDRFLI